MKYLICIFFSIFVPALAQADKVQPAFEVGNNYGQKSMAKGPGVARLQLQNCKINLNLETKDYIWFNEPDAIFYRSKGTFKNQEKPYLWQAETSSGYNWQFRKSGRIDDIWLGFMCAGLDEFYWNEDLSRADKKDEAQTEATLIKEDNKFKCPASKVNGKWEIDRKINSTTDYKLVEITGKNWEGFLLGIRNRKDVTYKEVRACLIHQGEVLLMSASDDTKKLRLPVDALNTYLKIISSINFID
jgi:hypothetical protein